MMQSQAATEDSPGRAYHCSCCTLIFKSKVYLFEHLNNVHGFDVDKALRESGLKQPSINKGSDYSCRHCDFTSSQWDVLTEHERQCPRNAEGKKGFGHANISENLSTKITVTSRNQHKEGAGTKDISSYFSVSSTSKTKCLPSSSKDLKTSKQPSQTIISYLTKLSGTRGNSPVMSSDSPDCTKGTLILQESPSDSGGVFKVTAKSQAGVPKKVSDHNSSTDISQKAKEEPTVANIAVKRTINENTEDPPAKKAKPCKEETKPLMNGMRQASSADFAFEISEDDESVHLVNGAAKSPTLYFCKHCDYKDVSIRCVSNHYQNKHPYVRFNSDYIQDPRDQSATFRCLECPVEFSAVSELKRHYRETHPKAPDVITMQSRDLSLLYRCFVCQFTCKELKDLKEHYKEKHPTHKADNPLLYYRYSVTRCQVASSRVDTCAMTPEKSEKNSPESTQASCKDVKSAASHQRVTSKRGDGATYKCNKCSFSHKSIIVIRVHYQKSHPDEHVSIEKIKQSRSASPIMPEKSNCTPQKDTSESLPSMSLAHSSETKIHLKLPKIKEEHSAEDGSKARKSLDKQAGQVSSEMDSSTDRMFYCPFCSYSSNKVRSVLGHHSAKHTRNGPTSIEELMIYSAKVQGKTLQTQEEVSGGTPSSHSEIIANQTDIRSKKPLQFEEHDAGVASLKASNAYDFPERLFYCQKCNFANPTLKGVLNHQNKLHKDLKSNMDTVLRHTALICNEIEESKSLTTELSCTTRLPLPLVNEGDENVFFCHYCNYRHGSMEQMMKHCFNRHHGCGITQEHIRLHTTLVREKTLGLPRKMTKDVKHASLEDKPVKKKNSKKLVKAPVSQMQRVLKCHRCSYVAQHLYVLRRHMWKVHRSNRSGPEILQMCYRQGSIQSGYHCDMCVFSQRNAQALYEHFQEQHPENKRSLEYISTRLYVGPDVCYSKSKGKVKHTEGGLPSQTSVENEAKTYSCKACSFKGSSLSEITCHYRAVHPWSVKEDGSDPGAKVGRKRSANGELKDQNEILASFDTYQIPLEFDSSSHEVFTCSLCPASFSTQHSLSTHCGMKHQGPPKEKQEPNPIKINRRVHVFKCPHCSYINSNYQGVITHCQMKHPALDFKADSLYLDRSCLKAMGRVLEQSSSGESLKHRGYMCKTCQQVYATTEKLNKHREKCRKTVNVLKPTSPASKMKPSTAEGAQETKTSLPRKKIYAVIRCQHCSYTCTTNIGLSRHLLIHHRDSSASKDFTLFTYKCALCSRVYCRKKRLANHYIKKHGKDAFLKYYKLVPQKSLAASAEPSSKNPESTSEQHKSSTVTSEKILVYQCPVCPYVNASFHGTLTHCQMKHPKLVVRADELQTQEIFVKNMVKCTVGKGSNERGYMCNKCPQIHASMLKLKIHIMCCHDHRNHSGEAEEQPGQSSTDPVSDGDFVKNPETSRSSAPSLQTKLQYKCHMCMYVGSCRKYLYCHYKYTHKLDGLSTIKLLEKYNIRKSRLAVALLQDGAQMKCKKCLNLTFGSSQLLIEHYSTCHRKMDFTILVKISQRSTGSYKCRHCKKVVHGIKNLLCHLDRHRARRMKKAIAAQAKFTTSAAPEAKANEQNELESTASVQGNVTPAETFTLQAPSKCTDEEHPEVESRDHKHLCKLCRRSFMSLKGLRSHERSHAALAAIKNLDNLPPSALKQNINKHVLYKAGTIRPFLCTFCSYRTTVLGLWKSHVMKKHQDFLMEAEETDGQEQKIFTKQPPYLTAENNNLPEPDVEPEKTEKSLYLEPPDVQRQLNQYSLMSSKSTLQEPMFSENSQLHCEFCNFNTGHLSSIRRHYQNRHGKKIFRCKDCDFLTGVRKTLEKHLETGHSTLQSETTQHKSHHCPFCLYQTKNKNNMIDHIVLHREERVVPIEVRRSKLSRYLQGIVFRCHKCTFTSGEAEKLRLHMMRHDDVRPYKCRLCFFDCPQLSDLEAHLSDKHQVIRNHELVGHVSLDQLEALCKVPEEEDESNLEQDTGNDQDVETDELDAHCSDVLPEALAKNPSDHDVVEKTDLRNLENEQDPQEEAVMTNDEGTKKTAVQFEDAPGQGTGRNMNLPLTKQGAAEWSSADCDEKAPKAGQHEASEGGDVLRHAPVMDEKGCERDGSVETEQNRNTEDRENKLLNEQSNITASKGPGITPDVKNQNSGAPGNQQSLTSTHGCAQPKISHEGDSSCKEEVVSLTDGEMPVLENVESSPLEFCKKVEALMNPHQEQEEASVKDTHPLQANSGAATVEAAQVSCPSLTENKLYTCKFCGRNLKSSQELTHHVMRHGM